MSNRQESVLEQMLTFKLTIETIWWKKKEGGGHSVHIDPAD